LANLAWYGSREVAPRQNNNNNNNDNTSANLRDEVEFYSTKKRDDTNGTAD
jgi:hypothetical protein